MDSKIALLAGKAIIVTGGARGTGAATVELNHRPTLPGCPDTDSPNKYIMI